MNTHTGSKPIFLADSCIGGLSVLQSLRRSGVSRDAYFLADYAVNPLGVKHESEIADVVTRWIEAAEQHSNVLICACNTLSIRYQQLLNRTRVETGLDSIITMVDCFKAMIQSEQKQLAYNRLLIVGTEYTVSQSTYRDLLTTLLPSVYVNAIPATGLERAIARFEPWKHDPDCVVTPALRQGLQHTDFAVLACTCFPFAQAYLEKEFPHVRFLDPGKYCHRLLKGNTAYGGSNLTVRVTGDVVTQNQVSEFAASLLGQECTTP